MTITQMPPGVGPTPGATHTCVIDWSTQLGVEFLIDETNFRICLLQHALENVAFLLSEKGCIHPEIIKKSRIVFATNLGECYQKLAYLKGLQQ